MELAADGTGWIKIDGKATITWGDGKITVNESNAVYTYTYKDGMIVLEESTGESMTFKKTDSADASSGLKQVGEDGSGAELTAHQQYWSGDWYGWIAYSNGTNIFADAVAGALRGDKGSDFKIECVSTPEDILQYSKIASIILMEVNGYPPYVLEERLKIRDAIKEVNPDCKIVLVVDENSEKKVAEEVRRAKKAGRIDQFIYGSISASYLVALMDTL